MKSCFKSKTFTTKILIVTVDYTCCNDKALACLKAHIKRLVKRKMKYSRNNSKIKKNSDYEYLQTIGTNFTKVISNSKNRYYEHLSNKFSDPTTLSKIYWSVLKILVNDKKKFQLYPQYLSKTSD